jgi:hypothetical protein
MPLRLTVCALIAVGLVGPARGIAAVQDNAPQKSTGTAAAKKPPAAKTTKPAAKAAPRQAPQDVHPTPALPDDPTLSSDESNSFLTGDPWQDTLLRFKQWLSVQTLYDARQVRQIQSRMADRVRKVAKGSQKEFIKEIDAKLNILYGPGTVALQNHLEESLAAATPAYVKKCRHQLPDVVGSTPEELKERLARFAMRHQSTAEVHQTFQQMKQLQIASDEARGESRRMERPRPSASHIVSAPTSNNRRSQGGSRLARDYFPQNNSSISYSIIPAMPMMTNSGWAMFGGGVAINITRSR